MNRNPVSLPFDASRFTAIGETLAVGYAHFGVYRDGQRWSFPALMAQQMGVEFPQILLEPPGICYSPGFEQQPVLMGSWLQSTVFETLPPEAPANFAVPGCTLSDAVDRRVQQPLICRHDAVQTGLNLIAGARALALGECNLPTLAEAAAARRPTLLLVELGFAEAVEAAVHGEVGRLPTRDSFRNNLRKLLSIFPRTMIVLLSVPDPFDTPYFLSLEHASEALRVPPQFLAQSYGVRPGDRLRLPGAHEIGGRLFARAISELPPGMVVPQQAVAEIGRRIGELNAEMQLAAVSGAAYFCDLRTAMCAIANCDFTVAGRRFTGRYLGGLFGVSGLYPGRTGQALLANQILAGINQATGAAIPLIDIARVAEADPQARQTPAGGSLWTEAELSAMSRRQTAQEKPAPQRAATSAPAPLEISHYGERPLPARLRLPPNLEQVLPLNPEASYFGDAISPVHCENPNDVMWGSSASHIFGGLALVDSHLHGQIRIRFSPPEGNVAKFTVDFGPGLTGDDAVLASPVMFRMPFMNNRVDAVPGTISSGEVNLETGETSKLRVFARYSSGALNALVRVNPSFPRTPLSFVSPDIADPRSEYGSANARFDPRPDGLLDFTFFGTRFIPLRGGIHWPLNFCGPEGQFALVPADGTIMRPHLRLSTAPVESGGAQSPNLPLNTLQEFTYHSKHCAFGDAFLLDIPDLGGVAKGRSHVMGRLLLQFGLPSGNSVPVAMCSLGPGGLFTPINESPITQAFPGRLAPGPTGFYEMLRFPRRTYALDELSILDDPFDLPVGAVDLRTGRMIGEQLHRGFIEQDLIFALVRIEPRTPRSSFYFRGPAIFETGPGGGLRFRYRGEVHIPYPKGLKFPQANLSIPYTVVKDSALDPFLWIRAVQDGAPDGAVLEGAGREILASIGEVFSYHFRISGSARDCFFEYVNHTQGGRLRMHSLAWVGFGRSPAAGNGAYDTATFTGFGVWEKDGRRSLQPFAAQFCTNATDLYAGIQVDAGDCSNVNTKPQKESDALP